MKFGLITEYNNIFQSEVEKLSPDPFLKNQNRACLRIKSLKFYTVEGSQYISKRSYKPLAFTSYKAFLKKQKDV